MSAAVLTIDSDGFLACPLCANTYVHIDDAYFAGYDGEDGPDVRVHVDSAGQVSTDEAMALPIPNAGRRHAFALTGWCEGCDGRFSMEFRQHKGQTVVTVRQPVWTEVVPPAITE